MNSVQEIGKRLVIVGSALLGVTLLTHCGDSVEPAALIPAAMLIVSGNVQLGTVHQQLDEPLVVRVVDADGRPINGFSDCLYSRGSVKGVE